VQPPPQPRAVGAVFAVGIITSDEHPLDKF